MIYNRLQKKDFATFYSLITIVAITISPTIFTEDGTGRNLMLITIMSISPIILIIYYGIHKLDWLLIILCAFLIINPLIYNPNTIRWSTMLYGCMFCLSFMAYIKVLEFGGLTGETYLKCLKYLIIAYAAVLLIQQVCVFTGLPIFNVSNYDPRFPWKLNSLSAEPSHSVRFAAILMFSYLSIKEIIEDKVISLKDSFKNDFWIWLAFFWVMITSMSSTAFVFIFIILIKYMRLQNIIPMLGLLLLVTIIIMISGNTTYERTLRFFLAAITFDDQLMIRTDPGAAARLAPLIICMKEIDFASVASWFGKGVDYASVLMNKHFPSVHTGGGVFALYVEYGFIPFIAYLICSIKIVINKFDIASCFFWLFICLNEGFNMQITWSALILFYTNKYMSNCQEVIPKSPKNIL